MSIFDKDLFGRSKHESALARIKNFCEGKRVLVAFSGGKDSQCCYHLCKEAGIEFSAQYSVTRFEPPELIQFIKANYPDVIFRKAFGKTLVDDIALHGLPTRWARWCCNAKHAKTPGFDIAVIGVRAEESPKRAATWRAFGYNPDHTAYVCPIIDWTTADVWEYLASAKQMRREAEIWPKSAAMLKLGAKKFVDRMAAQGFVTARGKPCADWCKAENPLEEFWGRWLATGQTAKPIEWQADGGEDENAPCLFAGTGFSESDGGEEDESIS